MVTVINLFICKEQSISDEDEDGSQAEGNEQLNVNVVPGTMKFPEEI